METKSRIFFNYKYAFFIIGIMFLFTLHVDASPKAEEISQTKDREELRFGLVGEVETLDPHNINDMNGEIVFAGTLYENLIEINNDMEAVPKLATKWNVSSDGKNWTFNLRKGVKFHDNTPFNAQAVKANFDRYINEKPRRWNLFQHFLQSVDVVDEYTVRINCTTPYAPFLTILATEHAQIISPTAYKRYGNKDFGRHPVGTGPFKFKEWIPDHEIVLEANEDYWDGAPRLNRIVYKPVPDATTRILMLEAGELDVILIAPLSEYNRIKESESMQAALRGAPNMVRLALNNIKPPFDNKMVRQAVACAINRKEIVENLFLGVGETAQSFALPYVKGAHIVDLWPYDPTKSLRILNQLGWSLGSDGILVKDGEPFNITIMTPSGRYPMDKQIAEAIQAQLREIGIVVKVVVLESTAFIKAILLTEEEKKKENVWDGMIISLLAGPDMNDALRDNFTTEAIPPGGINLSSYSNVKVDRLVKQGVVTLDENERQRIYKEVQEMLIEDVPMILINYGIDFAALSRKVHGVEYASPVWNITVTKNAWVEK